MANENVPIFTLKRVADWQLLSDEDKVELPDLQRGFVWKAAQIETLWDSLLRGYPVGAFLMSRDKDQKLFLMDGQQRAKAIALGYHNRWRGHDNLKSSAVGIYSKEHIPTVWIDLNPKEKSLSQKFLIRVLTVSHPWGYQAIKHTVILSLKDRLKALDYFEQNLSFKGIGYSKLTLNLYFLTTVIYQFPYHL